MGKDCIFCKLAKGELEASLLHRDDELAAFADASPQAPVHILIIPKKHIEGLKGLGGTEAHLAGRMLALANRLAGENGIGESGYRLVINSGRDAGQAVPHLHLHLLGGRKMAWPPG